MRHLFRLPVAVLIALTVFQACAFAQGLSGRRAPGFSLPDSGFQQHDLLDHRGQWVFLFFVRTDNAMTQPTAQLLEASAAQSVPKAAVLYVGVSPVENQATVAKFAAAAKVKGAIVFDQGQMAASYFKATPTNPNIDLPHLFAINPAGLIVKDWTEGDLKDQKLRSQIDSLMQPGSSNKK